MNYLIDTNVLSELRKRERAHPGVTAWVASVDTATLYTSVLVLGEIRRGIERRRRTDRAQADALDRWLEQVRVGLRERVLPIDERVAEVWGGLGVVDPVPVVDGLLAATALAHDMTLVSRNVRDLERTGARLLDPFAFGA